MVLDELYQKTEEHMKKSLEMLTHELGGIRTGKASPALLDSLRVNYYGSMVPVKQIANVAVPDPRLITIQPWDPSTLPLIEKAIRSSDLDLNPQNDGKIIRVPIPQLTEELRGLTAWTAPQIRAREERLLAIVDQMWQLGKAASGAGGAPPRRPRREPGPPRVRRRSPEPRRGRARWRSTRRSAGGTRTSA